MTEQTALVIFVGMTAFAWVAIALVVVLIGIQIVKLLRETRELLAHVKSAGEAAIADVEELRSRLRAEGSKVWGIVDFAVRMATKKLVSKRARPKKEEEL